MIKVWHDDAWEDYLHWQQESRSTLRRVNALIRDIERSPFDGIGKPEPLKGDLSGWWSRRIDEANRIVYRVVNGELELLRGDLSGWWSRRDRRGQPHRLSRRERRIGAAAMRRTLQRLKTPGKKPGVFISSARNAAARGCVRRDG